MTLWKTEHALTPRRAVSPVNTPAEFPDFAALAVVSVAPAVLLLLFVPLRLVLPLLSIASFAVAVAAALVAHRSGLDRRTPGVTAWDISALFTAIWIIAGLTSGMRPFAELFERLAVGP